MEAEIERLKKFQDSLRLEGKVIFEGLLNQSKQNVSVARCVTSSVKEMRLIISILFAHQKKLAELEKRIRKIQQP